MADVNKLAPFILQWEGGFVNDPDDLGGATNKGITLSTYESFCRRKGYPKPTVERLKNISQTDWIEILKTMYWDKWKADQIMNQSVANILVDWVWASGGYGIKRPQKILGVKVDGIVGSLTISAVNACDSRELFYAIKSDRIKFIDEICESRPVNNKFKRGWLNRINAIKFEP
ncbi:peptidoglycan domain protein [Parabacteroides acidifaciens]|uniref:Peptidoglycan domain protein n=1 Tax=Parabacteroides acidifaciens TaxID=2290935 RepID=A0A3D8H8J7_9BACT|nr:MULTISPECIES: glycosyl hydrolase 108 family protein [Parabacteroides]MBC8603942.1 peptidoglycan domain protein [Parabacteroides acidifaciens]RDU47315.1 peptidoglycan domain protein [Parabacteroides acidifaciens]RHO67355.1 peptidoglycan domain protein [Parabacteroides sp. AF48-14]